MKKAFTVHLISYDRLLKSMSFRYREDEKTLTVGKMIPGCAWALFISCRTLLTADLFTLILPLLKQAKVPFRIIKNQLLQYRLNSGDFGENEVGKVLSVFPSSEVQAGELIREIRELSIPFKGPVVPDAQRVSGIIYVQRVEQRMDDIVFSLPAKNGFPFFIPPAYALKQKRKFLTRRFLPVQVLRSSPKGDIYKAIDLRHLAFNWCLIKEGKPVALDDHFDRDMRDRLLWQLEVLQTLQDNVHTPPALVFFEKNDSAYLVTAFAEGPPLSRLVVEFFAGRQWKELDAEKQAQLLRWFLEAVDLVGTIHEQGFVHRDVTDTNFILGGDGRLCIIDFELSYNIRLEKPDPPFLLGTYGYAAPEQLQYAVPDFSEDVYSLGALLCFMLTGIRPVELLHQDHHQNIARLCRLTGESGLSRLAFGCLNEKRQCRPTLKALRDGVNHHFTILNLTAI